MRTGQRFVAIAAAISFCGGVVAVAPGAGAAAKPAKDPGSNPAYEAALAHYAAQDVYWAPCYPDGYAPEFECAVIYAPRDWAHPENGDIDVQLSRILATGKRRGVLQTNPGGPGGAGRFMPLYLEEAEPEIAAHYDVVGMDPRGVAVSTELDCEGTGALEQLYALDGHDQSPANIQRFLRGSKQVANGCAKDPLTPYIDTDQTVRDVDLVRAIFGDAKTSWLGYSAGTWMGAWYATQFPSRVDRFLLDGNMNWTTNWYDGFMRAQGAAFQRRFDEDLLPWLAKYDALLHLGNTMAKVRKTIDARRVALNRHPLILTDGTRLTGVDYESTIIGYLYSDASFPDLARALSILERYSTATPEEQDEATFALEPYPLDQSENVFWSVMCNDTPAPSATRVFSDYLTTASKIPLTGAGYLGLPCVDWKIPAIGSPVTGKGIPPLLMIQDDGDPATPYATGLQAHKNTPGSVFVTVKHEGDHTIFGGQDACVEKIGNDWLVRGVLPKKDVSCAGIPMPDLNASAASAAALRSAASAPAVGVTPEVWGKRLEGTRPIPSR